MFWATVGLVAISVIAAITNYLALAASTEPHVVVYAKADQSRPQVVQIVIENVGHRVARDIRFTLSEPLPNRFIGGWGTSHSEAGLMTTGPLIEGIPALGPKDTRVMFWGTYHNLHEFLGDRIVIVTARYRSTPLLARSDWNEYEVQSVVEVHSFTDGEAVDPDGARQSARELKRIADLLKSRFDA
jgi:hypothetical protein